MTAEETRKAVGRRVWVLQDGKKRRGVIRSFDGMGVVIRELDEPAGVVWVPWNTKEELWGFADDAES